MKGAGSLIVSISVNDLVFLQTLWMINCWAVAWWLTKKDFNAMVCQGCLRWIYELVRMPEVRSNADTVMLLVVHSEHSEHGETLQPTSAMKI